MSRIRPGLVLLVGLCLVAALPWPVRAADEEAEAAPEAAAEAPKPRSEPACANAVAGKVQRHYEAVRDLSARFTQTTQVVALGTASQSNATTSGGAVDFSKPGRMRWAYEHPEPSLVVTDGQDLWIYDPGMKEAQKYHAGEGFLSGAALQFLLGEGEMARDFRVKAISCQEDEARLDLRPRRAAAYEHLEIRVDPGTGEVRETAVFDLVGNVTRVAFEDVRTNSGLGEELFRFSPPEGVRVVEVPEARQ